MPAAEPKHKEKAAAAHEERKPTTATRSPQGASVKTLLPLTLTPAERRGLLMVVTVALLQEVHSSVFRGAVVGVVSVAMAYSQLSRLHKTP
ncbi:hypothetical protein GH5_04237 [Leishmania sp. Ghana 2012 LV757]|uniref:hypothetical protein n=1 Tax=Leishmania sp. Ghana 2012 LV757 TaxID=2803181 RepID=UPI001B45E163|nr:hypothetical protein GH5_04237 [Leishmania sp. Ghana 2012 LV757]